MDNRCAVEPILLAKPITFETLRFETIYQVDFSFTCRGNGVGFGFTADEDLSNITALEASRISQRVEVRGSSDLWITDPKPDKTLGLTFHKGCEGRVLSVNRLPTEQTFEQWKALEKEREALSFQTGIILDLLKNFAKYREWSTSTVSSVSEALKNLETTYSAQCKEYEGTDLGSCDAVFDVVLVRETLELAIAYDPTNPAYAHAIGVYGKKLELEAKRLDDLRTLITLWTKTEERP
ncbi:MAG: hypothetical protein EOP04_03870 [Proteobacteria bacterium]|nr:MAG: hypothetical protein EOP04_03870 [Pseudomonadota bacterium]